MKTRLAILIGAGLAAATVRGAAEWHDDFEAAKALAAKENKDLLLDFTGSHWCTWSPKEQGETPGKESGGTEGKSSFFVPSGGSWLVGGEQQAAAEEKPAQPEAEKAGAAKEAELRKAVEEAERDFAEITKKLDDDHAAFERLEREMPAAREKIAELKAALAKEQARLADMERTEERLEGEHNGDHDKQDALQVRLEERRAALKEFEDNQDEITKLEKQAAELRKQAEELRKRAEELKGQ